MLFFTGSLFAMLSQHSRMELEAAVIDGARFLCYDDDATGSA